MLASCRCWAAGVPEDVQRGCGRGRVLAEHRDNASGEARVVHSRVSGRDRYAAYRWERRAQLLRLSRTVLTRANRNWRNGA